jgi:Ketopantoate reductase PanE/ApbA
VRFVVYGAGAIGSVLGARLHQAGHDVVLIARGRHLDALRERGLRIEDPDRQATVKLEVVGRPGDARVGRDDVVNRDQRDPVSHLGREHGLSRHERADPRVEHLEERADRAQTSQPHGALRPPARVPLARLLQGASSSSAAIASRESGSARTSSGFIGLPKPLSAPYLGPEAAGIMSKDVGGEAPSARRHGLHDRGVISRPSQSTESQAPRKS